MERFKEYLRFVMINIAGRKKRSLLTIVAIVIGISSVVALISLGYGLQNTIDEQFSLMGSDKLMIMPGSTMMTMFGGGGVLTEDDMDVVKGVDGISIVGGMIYKSARVEFKGQSRYTFVIGLPTDDTKEVVSSMQNFNVLEGRELKESDTNSVVVGYLIANGAFFDQAPSIGDRIKIENVNFKIVGVMDKIGNNADDSQIYVPLDVAKDLFSEPDKMDIIIAQTEKGYDTSVVAEDVEEAMRKDRGVEEGEEDFSVQTSEQLMDTFSSVFSLVLMVVIGIAAISLIVGGVGIMNTMYMSILERTREIGVMKSIGAMNRDVLLIFLIESGLLGLFGGLAGCGLGIALAKLMEIALQGQFLALKVYISAELVAGALLFSFMVGVISGFLPARRAANLDPVEALRYE